MKITKKQFQWEFIEYYKGIVEADTVDQAHDLICEQMANKSDDNYDGGELTMLDEITESEQRQ